MREFSKIPPFIYLLFTWYSRPAASSLPPTYWPHVSFAQHVAPALMLWISSPEYLISADQSYHRYQVQSPSRVQEDTSWMVSNRSYNRAERDVSMRIYRELAFRARARKMARCFWVSDNESVANTLTAFYANGRARMIYLYMPKSCMSK